MSWCDPNHQAPRVPPGGERAGCCPGGRQLRLVVRRVDRDDKVDLVVHEREVVYAVTVAGSEHVNGRWKNRPISWPVRGVFVALADGGLYRTQERSLMPLKAALPSNFVTVHTGVVVNLDRVRFVLRDRPLLLGFPRLGSADPREALWAEVARGRTRGVLDMLGWIRRSARDGASVTRNVDEVDESGDAPLKEAIQETFGRRDDDDEPEG